MNPPRPFATFTLFGVELDAFVYEADSGGVLFQTSDLDTEYVLRESTSDGLRVTALTARWWVPRGRRELEALFIPTDFVLDDLVEVKA